VTRKTKQAVANNNEPQTSPVQPTAAVRSARATEWLTDADVEREYRVKRGTLRYRRSVRMPPEYYRIGKRTVRYTRRSREEWLASRLVRPRVETERTKREPDTAAQVRQDGASTVQSSDRDRPMIQTFLPALGCMPATAQPWQRAEWFACRQRLGLPVTAEMDPMTTTPAIV
jgi:hypothetical protein